MMACTHVYTHSDIDELPSAHSIPPVVPLVPLTASVPPVACSPLPFSSILGRLGKLFNNELFPLRLRGCSNLGMSLELCGSSFDYGRLIASMEVRCAESDEVLDDDEDEDSQELGDRVGMGALLVYASD